MLCICCPSRLHDWAISASITWAHRAAQVCGGGGGEFGYSADTELSLKISTSTETPCSLFRFFSSTSYRSGHRERPRWTPTCPSWSIWTRTTWSAWSGGLICCEGTSHSLWWSTQRAGWALVSVPPAAWRGQTSSWGDLDPAGATLL